MNERAHRLAQLLTTLGYMAEASEGDSSMLREHNCAIRAVIERFPEICVAEKSFLEEVLGANVTRQTHIAAGANCCEYCIHPSDSSGTNAGTVAGIAADVSASLVQIGSTRPGASALQETP
jgi:predicted ArsR family transcriptional regulator